MPRTWNVLVVDDEPDMHTVTQLALRHKRWRGRGVNLLRAMSGKEAREILQTPAAADLHVALVDVVMESEHAGLELCEFIRKTMPLSLRIILRTGQPGAAPEETVMNDYDIDFYLAKSDVTEQRLFMALRAACRSSLDLATSIALGNQLRRFIDALQSPTIEADALAGIMRESLQAVERKHDVSLVFVDNATRLAAGAGGPDQAQLGKLGLSAKTLADAITAAHAIEGVQLVPGERVGLSSNDFVFPLRALQASVSAPTDRGGKLGRVMRIMLGGKTDEAQVEETRGGLYVHVSEPLRQKEMNDLAADLVSFGENWRVASALLSLRERTVHDRMAALEAAGVGSAI